MNIVLAHQRVPREICTEGHTKEEEKVHSWGGV